jgi:hypothetical protein
MADIAKITLKGESEAKNFIDEALRGDIAYEELSTTVSKTGGYVAGDHLIYLGQYYEVVADIAQGGTIVTSGAGQNVEEREVGDEIKKNKTQVLGVICDVETSPATAAHSAGDQFYYDGALVEATSAIAIGDTIVVSPDTGYNVKVADKVVAQIQTLTNQVTTNKNDITNLKSRVSNLESEVSWLEVVNDLRNGDTSKYAIGDLFNEPWIDTANNNASYDNPLRINHFETVEIEGGETVSGMWLQHKYAHPFGVQFSHQRAFLKCPSGLAAGTYYFTIESAWGSNVSAGDIVCFTIANAVPEGGRIAGCYGAPDQVKSNWRVYVYSADGKTILETITPTFTASGTSLGTMKSNTRNGNLNSMQETAYGWNRWSKSALRQYLNSDAVKGTWWTAQDEWDIAPDQLTAKDGFLRGLSAGLKEILLPVKTITYVNTVNDGGADDFDVTYDKVSLTSLQQMYINPQHTGEGETQDYWKELNGTSTPWAQGGTYEVLKQYAVENHSSAQDVRLRSANRGYAVNTWYVSSSGGVYGGGASGALRFEPLMFI